MAAGGLFLKFIWQPVENHRDVFGTIFHHDFLDLNEF